ncbi:hypothetical protein U3516DRAFT_807152 [Neocallimastix sp. 'constans']
MGFICSGYNSIKSQVIRSRRKQLPPELFSKKNIYIFVDGTFHIAPIFNYRVFITRTNVTELNCFYTTSFTILKNKNKYNSIEITPKIFHCDFEKAIFNDAEKVFTNANIKYCI